MAQKGRHRRGGRTTPKGTRPQRFRPRGGDEWPEWEEQEPDLMGDVSRALADPHPLRLMTMVSTLLTVVDPRQADPFKRTTDEPATLVAADLVQSFVEIDRPETSAMLAVVAAFSTDDVQRRRLERTVAGRAHRLPVWLAGLSAARAYRATEMVHILGDGDNVMVGARLPTGEELTAVVYVDHNMGTLVKDAFVVPDRIEAVVRLMRDNCGDPDTRFADLPLADAKARIVGAIATGAMTYPPFETETWPSCRPLVEWVTDLLPDGGRGYERPEWSEVAQADLAERFFDSGFGAPIDGRDHRGLLDSILWFGTGYGPGDPMRWSPVAVEILLLDWIPRKIVADVPYLSKAPDVLRAFIRFCHRERGIPPYLTEETLTAVDKWEPEYQITIRSPRLQGPAALLAAVNPSWDYESMLQGFAERAVGGPGAVAALDDDPLPDEAFDWTGVADDVRDRVGEVLALVDDCCDELLDVEHRTACRRVLARIAVNGPEVFRRRGRADTAAAAICWSVCRANDTFDQRAGGFTQKRLLGQFGLQGSISSRARTLLQAGGFPAYWADSALRSPDYLVAARRRAIIARRDRLGL